MKKIIYQILPIFIAFTFAIFITNCGPEEIIDEEEEEEDWYLDDDEIEVVHVVGDSSCPQDVIELLVDEDGVNGTLTPIDSATFSCSHASIEVYCNDITNQSFCDFKQGETQKVKVEFNCAAPTSVDAQLSCNFYDSDTLVGNKMIPLKVNVKQ